LVCMKTIEVESYAKINLTLEVLARRPDGYHDLDSVVQVIDLADSLSVSVIEDGAIEVDVDGQSREVPSGRENLIYRACQAFFGSTGISCGVRCLLKKRIPAQAGLGGGSGNAAAALRALNELCSACLDEDELISIAASIGSDVALFVRGGTVRMRGRGDIVEPLPDAPTLHLVLAKPDVGVSTVWAYGELDTRGVRESGAATDKAERAVKRGDRAELIGSIQNDFDAVVTSRFLEVALCRDLLLNSGAERAVLCGSGSAVFGVYSSRDAAASAAKALRGRVPWLATARSLPRRTNH